MVTDYDVLQAAEVWWSTQPSLRALFSDGKLWHLSAPETTQLPYLTYFLVSEPAETWTTGYAFWRSTLQLNVHHWTSAAARSLAIQLAGAMSTIPPLNAIFPGAGATLVIHGQNAVHVLPGAFGVEVGQGLAPNGKDCWICHFELDVPWVN